MFSAVEEEVGAMVDAGCIPLVMGGNAGPTTYPVLKAIAERADGTMAVLNLDAHGDNQPGGWEEDDPRAPRWAVTWALRILPLPSVDPARYYHFGLRGPRNDPGTVNRFVELGVEREHIYTYREIRGARQAGYDEWVEKLARKLPQTTRYAKQQLNWWRDVSWHETVGHARDWLALSMLNDEAKEAIERFLKR